MKNTVLFVAFALIAQFCFSQTLSIEDLESFSMENIRKRGFVVLKDSVNKENYVYELFYSAKNEKLTANRKVSSDGAVILTITYDILSKDGFDKLMNSMTQHQKYKRKSESYFEWKDGTYAFNSFQFIRKTETPHFRIVYLSSAGKELSVPKE
jgi:hypothetical protein